MLKVINQDIHITRGDTGYFSITLYKTHTLFENDDIYIMQPNDLCTFTVRKSEKSPTNPILIQKEFILNPTINKYEIKIEPVDTETLAFGQYLYDIELVYGDNGDINTVVTPHKFILAEEVT